MRAQGARSTGWSALQARRTRSAPGALQSTTRHAPVDGAARWQSPLVTNSLCSLFAPCRSHEDFLRANYSAPSGGALHPMERSSHPPKADFSQVIRGCAGVERTPDPHPLERAPKGGARSRLSKAWSAWSAAGSLRRSVFGALGVLLELAPRFRCSMGGARSALRRMERWSALHGAAHERAPRSGEGARSIQWSAPRSGASPRSLQSPTPAPAHPQEVVSSILGSPCGPGPLQSRRQSKANHQ